MQFTFVSTNYAVLENATNAVITVQRYGITNLLGSVRYFTSDGSATNGVDYRGVTNTLTFLPGVKLTNFSVPIIDNQIVQLNRSLNLTLNNATSTSTNNVVSTNNASIGTNAAAVLTIIDNDNTFSFSATDYVVSEAAGNLQVNVLRSGQNTGVVSVVCATVPLSIANAATPGADYVAVSATDRKSTRLNSSHT